jgi:hypothetical protein
MWAAKIRRVAGSWVGTAALIIAMNAAAQAQVPASPEAAEIAACLCLRQSVDILGADMSAKERAYGSAREEVAALDAQLQSLRAVLDVNDRRAVAEFRQLLERRDAVHRHSAGPLIGDLAVAVERYNARADEHNARCANRPRNPVLLGQVQATLICPPPN